MADMTSASWGLPDPDRHPEFYADVPVKRAAAWLIDALIIFVLTLLILPFTAFTGLFFYPLLWITVSLIYRVATVTSGSATLGMRVMSIELRTLRGERFGFAEAFLHTVGFLVSFSFLIPQIISIVLMLTTARAQGLHDLVLGTAAVNRSR